MATEKLNELKSSLTEVSSVEEELETLNASMGADEMKKKEEEMRETKGRLKEIERKIGGWRLSLHGGISEPNQLALFRIVKAIASFKFGRR